LKDKSYEEIQEMINQTLHENNMWSLADIAFELLDEIQWLRAIKVANEKLIKELESSKSK